jgi:cytoskeletal protein RodZ
MNIIRFTVSAAVIGVLSSTIAFAQQTPPPESTTSPSSASSPSQRDATRNSASEAPATSGAQPADASTAHQREAMAGHPKTMKECMDQQAAKKDGMSKSDMTKACDEQMKMQKDRTHMSKAPANSPTTTTPKESEGESTSSPK